MSSSADQKAVCLKYFTHIENDIWKCKCNKMLKKKQGTGWSNLMVHIRTQHETSNTSTSQSTLEFMHCKKSETIYGWLEWVSIDLRPFSCVEQELTRKYSKLEKITVPTLQKYMHLVANKVEAAIEKELPEKFA